MVIRTYLLVVLAVFSCNLSADEKLRILLTNDDGVESSLLIALATRLSQDYDLVISAPRENQSGSSHASNSASALLVEEIRLNNSLLGYGVHGLPADAARFGIFQLGKEKPFDLVISGINRGANVGNVAHLSGTVGAAMEALYHGIPAIAVSQDARANTEISIQLTLQVIQHIQQQALPSGTLVSINVPAGNVTQVVAKPMGGSYLGFQPFKITEEKENSKTYQSGLAINRDETADNDTRAYQQGIATITPLKLDWTDYTFLETANSWQLKIDE